MTLHIALAGPASLDLLEPHLEPGLQDVLRHRGYPFPLLPRLAVGYLSRGHRVTIVSTSSDVRRVTPYIGRDLSVMIVPSRPRARDRALDFFAVERAGIRDALSQVNPDVAHAHWTYEFALGALAQRRCPTLTTAHDAPLTVFHHMPDVYRAVRGVMAYRTRFSATHLTAVSPYLADRWQRQMLYRKQIDVIPNPLSDDFAERIRAARRVPVVLSVADNSRRKNVWGLLQAFALFREQFPLAELRIVGNGLSAEEQFARDAAAVGLAHSVSFLGRLNWPALRDEYRTATVFCHPSLEESQGMVLLEALQAGLPVVAGRNSGAVAWTLFDGAAGSLTDVRQPSAIANALAQVVRDPSSSQRSGFNIEAALNRRFGMETVLDRYLVKYNHIIGEQLHKA